ncbi:MAG: hypothetical protein WC850_00135 [Candidatus Gracilibacteria bacterium]
MSLLFLVTYIVISYFIYKKNKDNLEQIPLVIKLTGIIAFALLFVFIVYYSEQLSYNTDQIFYVYSFYFLFIGYFTTFIVYLLRYKKILVDKNYKFIYNDKAGFLETWINKFYFIVLLFISGVYFLYSKNFLNNGSDGLQVLIYLFFISSSLYILFGNNLFSYKNNKIS